MFPRFETAQSGFSTNREDYYVTSPAVIFPPRQSRVSPLPISQDMAFYHSAFKLSHTGDNSKGVSTLPPRAPCSDPVEGTYIMSKCPIMRSYPMAPDSVLRSTAQLAEPSNMSYSDAAMDLIGTKNAQTISKLKLDDTISLYYNFCEPVSLNSADLLGNMVCSRMLPYTELLQKPWYEKQAISSVKESYQYVEMCYTCNVLMNQCSVCAQTCHKGHHLGPVVTSTMTRTHSFDNKTIPELSGVQPHCLCGHAGAKCVASDQSRVVEIYDGCQLQKENVDISPWIDSTKWDRETSTILGDQHSIKQLKKQQKESTDLIPTLKELFPMVPQLNLSVTPTTDELSVLALVLASERQRKDVDPAAIMKTHLHKMLSVQHDYKLPVYVAPSYTPTVSFPSTSKTLCLDVPEQESASLAQTHGGLMTQVYSTMEWSSFASLMVLQGIMEETRAWFDCHLHALSASNDVGNVSSATMHQAKSMSGLNNLPIWRAYVPSHIHEKQRAGKGRSGLHRPITAGVIMAQKLQQNEQCDNREQLDELSTLAMYEHQHTRQDGILAPRDLAQQILSSYVQWQYFDTVSNIWRDYEADVNRYIEWAWREERPAASYYARRSDDDVERDHQNELNGQEVVGSRGNGNVAVNDAGEGRLAFAQVTICFNTFSEHHRYALYGREKTSYSCKSNNIGLPQRVRRVTAEVDGQKSIIPDELEHSHTAGHFYGPASAVEAQKKLTEQMMVESADKRACSQPLPRTVKYKQYVYFLDGALGLVRWNTKTGESLQRPELSIHAEGYIAVGEYKGELTIFLRTPLSHLGELILLDGNSLETKSEVIRLKRSHDKKYRLGTDALMSGLLYPWAPSLTAEPTPVLSQYALDLRSIPAVSPVIFGAGKESPQSQHAFKALGAMVHRKTSAGPACTCALPLDDATLHVLLCVPAIKQSFSDMPDLHLALAPIFCLLHGLTCSKGSSGKPGSLTSQRAACSNLVIDGGVDGDNNEFGWTALAHTLDTTSTPLPATFSQGEAMSKSSMNTKVSQRLLELLGGKPGDKPGALAGLILKPIWTYLQSLHSQPQPLWHSHFLYRMTFDRTTLPVTNPLAGSLAAPPFTLEVFRVHTNLLALSRSAGLADNTTRNRASPFPDKFSVPVPVVPFQLFTSNESLSGAALPSLSTGSWYTVNLPSLALSAISAWVCGPSFNKNYNPSLGEQGTTLSFHPEAVNNLHPNAYKYQCTSTSRMLELDADKAALVQDETGMWLRLLVPVGSGHTTNSTILVSFRVRFAPHMHHSQACLPIFYEDEVLTCLNPITESSTLPQMEDLQSLFHCSVTLDTFDTSTALTEEATVVNIPVTGAVPNPVKLMRIFGHARDQHISKVQQFLSSGTWLKDPTSWTKARFLPTRITASKPFVRKSPSTIDAPQCHPADQSGHYSLEVLPAIAYNCSSQHFKYNGSPVNFAVNEVYEEVVRRTVISLSATSAISTSIKHSAASQAKQLSLEQAHDSLSHAHSAHGIGNQVGMRADRPIREYTVQTDFCLEKSVSPASVTPVGVPLRVSKDTGCTMCGNIAGTTDSASCNFATHMYLCLSCTMRDCGGNGKRLIEENNVSVGYYTTSSGRPGTPMGPLPGILFCSDCANKYGRVCMSSNAVVASSSVDKTNIDNRTPRPSNPSLQLLEWVGSLISHFTGSCGYAGTMKIDSKHMDIHTKITAPDTSHNHSHILVPVSLSPAQALPQNQDKTAQPYHLDLRFFALGINDNRLLAFCPAQASRLNSSPLLPYTLNNPQQDPTFTALVKPSHFVKKQGKEGRIPKFATAAVPHVFSQGFLSEFRHTTMTSEQFSQMAQFEYVNPAHNEPITYSQRTLLPMAAAATLHRKAVLTCPQLLRSHQEEPTVSSLTQSAYLRTWELDCPVSLRGPDVELGIDATTAAFHKNGAVYLDFQTGSAFLTDDIQYGNLATLLIQMDEVLGSLLHAKSRREDMTSHAHTLYKLCSRIHPKEWQGCLTCPDMPTLKTVLGGTMDHSQFSPAAKPVTRTNSEMNVGRALFSVAYLCEVLLRQSTHAPTTLEEKKVVSHDPPSPTAHIMTKTNELTLVAEQCVKLQRLAVEKLCDWNDTLTVLHSLLVRKEGEPLLWFTTRWTELSVLLQPINLIDSWLRIDMAPDLFTGVLHTPNVLDDTTLVQLFKPLPSKHVSTTMDTLLNVLKLVQKELLPVPVLRVIVGMTTVLTVQCSLSSNMELHNPTSSFMDKFKKQTTFLTAPEAAAVLLSVTSCIVLVAAEQGKLPIPPCFYAALKSVQVPIQNIHNSTTTTWPLLVSLLSRNILQHEKVNLPSINTVTQLLLDIASTNNRPLNKYKDSDWQQVVEILEPAILELSHIPVPLLQQQSMQDAAVIHGPMGSVPNTGIMVAASAVFSTYARRFGSSSCGCELSPLAFERMQSHMGYSNNTRWALFTGLSQVHPSPLAAGFSKLFCGLTHHANTGTVTLAQYLTYVELSLHTPKLETSSLSLSYPIPVTRSAALLLDELLTVSQQSVFTMRCVQPAYMAYSALQTQLAWNTPHTYTKAKTLPIAALTSLAIPPHVHLLPAKYHTQELSNSISLLISAPPKRSMPRSPFQSIDSATLRGAVNMVRLTRYRDSPLYPIIATILTCIIHTNATPAQLEPHTTAAFPLSQLQSIQILVEPSAWYINTQMAVSLPPKASASQKQACTAYLLFLVVFAENEKQISVHFQNITTQLPISIAALLSLVLSLLPASVFKRFARIQTTSINLRQCLMKCCPSFLTDALIAMKPQFHTISTKQLTMTVPSASPMSMIDENAKSPSVGHLARFPQPPASPHSSPQRSPPLPLPSLSSTTSIKTPFLLGSTRSLAVTATATNTTDDLLSPPSKQQRTMPSPRKLLLVAMDAQAASLLTMSVTCLFDSSKREQAVITPIPSIPPVALNLSSLRVQVPAFTLKLHSELLVFSETVCAHTIVLTQEAGSRMHRNPTDAIHHLKRSVQEAYDHAVKASPLYAVMQPTQEANSISFALAQRSVVISATVDRQLHAIINAAMLWTVSDNLVPFCVAIHFYQAYIKQEMDIGTEEAVIHESLTLLPALSQALRTVIITSQRKSLNEAKILLIIQPLLSLVVQLATLDLQTGPLTSPKPQTTNTTIHQITPLKALQQYVANTSKHASSLKLESLLLAAMTVVAQRAPAVLASDGNTPIAPLSASSLDQFKQALQSPQQGVILACTNWVSYAKSSFLNLLQAVQTIGTNTPVEQTSTLVTNLIAHLALYSRLQPFASQKRSQKRAFWLHGTGVGKTDFTSMLTSFLGLLQKHIEGSAYLPSRVAVAQVLFIHSHQPGILPATLIQTGGDKAASQLVDLFSKVIMNIYMPSTPVRISGTHGAAVTVQSRSDWLSLQMHINSLLFTLLHTQAWSTQVTDALQADANTVALAGILAPMNIPNQTLEPLLYPSPIMAKGTTVLFHPDDVVSAHTTSLPYVSPHRPSLFSLLLQSEPTHLGYISEKLNTTGEVHSYCSITNRVTVTLRSSVACREQPSIDANIGPNQTKREHKAVTLTLPLHRVYNLDEINNLKQNTVKLAYTQQSATTMTDGNNENDYMEGLALLQKKLLTQLSSQNTQIISDDIAALETMLVAGVKKHLLLHALDSVVFVVIQLIGVFASHLPTPATTQTLNGLQLQTLELSRVLQNEHKAFNSVDGGEATVQAIRDHVDNNYKGVVHSNTLEWPWQESAMLMHNYLFALQVSNKVQLESVMDDTDDIVPLYTAGSRLESLDSDLPYINKPTLLNSLAEVQRLGFATVYSLAAMANTSGEVDSAIQGQLAHDYSVDLSSVGFSQDIDAYELNGMASGVQHSEWQQLLERQGVRHEVDRYWSQQVQLEDTQTRQNQYTAEHFESWARGLNVLTSKNDKIGTVNPLIDALVHHPPVLTALVANVRTYSQTRVLAETDIHGQHHAHYLAGVPLPIPKYKHAGTNSATLPSAPALAAMKATNTGKPGAFSPGAVIGVTVHGFLNAIATKKPSTSTNSPQSTPSSPIATKLQLPGSSVLVPVITTPLLSAEKLRKVQFQDMSHSNFTRATVVSCSRSAVLVRGCSGVKASYWVPKEFVIEMQYPKSKLLPLYATRRSVFSYSNSPYLSPSQSSVSAPLSNSALYRDTTQFPSMPDSPRCISGPVAIDTLRSDSDSLAHVQLLTRDVEKAKHWGILRGDDYLNESHWKLIAAQMCKQQDYSDPVEVIVPGVVPSDLIQPSDTSMWLNQQTRQDFIMSYHHIHWSKTQDTHSKYESVPILQGKVQPGFGGNGTPEEKSAPVPTELQPYLKNSVQTDSTIAAYGTVVSTQSGYVWVILGKQHSKEPVLLRIQEQHCVDMALQPIMSTWGPHYTSWCSVLHDQKEIPQRVQRAVTAKALYFTWQTVQNQAMDLSKAVYTLQQRLGTCAIHPSVHKVQRHPMIQLQTVSLQLEVPDNYTAACITASHTAASHTVTRTGHAETDKQLHRRIFREAVNDAVHTALITFTVDNLRENARRRSLVLRVPVDQSQSFSSIEIDNVDYTEICVDDYVRVRSASDTVSILRQAILCMPSAAPKQRQANMALQHVEISLPCVPPDTTTLSLPALLLLTNSAPDISFYANQVITGVTGHDASFSCPPNRLHVPPSIAHSWAQNSTMLPNPVLRPSFQGQAQGQHTNFTLMHEGSDTSRFAQCPGLHNDKERCSQCNNTQTVSYGGLSTGICTNDQLDPKGYLYVYPESAHILSWPPVRPQSDEPNLYPMYHTRADGPLQLQSKKATPSCAVKKAQSTASFLIAFPHPAYRAMFSMRFYSDPHCTQLVHTQHKHSPLPPAFILPNPCFVVTSPVLPSIFVDDAAQGFVHDPEQQYLLPAPSSHVVALYQRSNLLSSAALKASMIYSKPHLFLPSTQVPYVHLRQAQIAQLTLPALCASTDIALLAHNAHTRPNLVQLSPSPLRPVLLLLSEALSKTLETQTATSMFFLRQSITHPLFPTLDHADAWKSFLFSITTLVRFTSLEVTLRCYSESDHQAQKQLFNKNPNYADDRQDEEDSIIPRTPVEIDLLSSAEDVQPCTQEVIPPLPSLSLNGALREYPNVQSERTPVPLCGSALLLQTSTCYIKLSQFLIQCLDPIDLDNAVDAAGLILLYGIITQQQRLVYGYQAQYTSILQKTVKKPVLPNHHADDQILQLCLGSLPTALLLHSLTVNPTYVATQQGYKRLHSSVPQGGCVALFCHPPEYMLVPPSQLPSEVASSFVPSSIPVSQYMTPFRKLSIDGLPITVLVPTVHITPTNSYVKDLCNLKATPLWCATRPEQLLDFRNDVVPQALQKYTNNKQQSAAFYVPDSTLPSRPVLAQQLAHLRAIPYRLQRTSVGYIPMLCLLAGTQHTGAVGVAGTFRQAITECCAQLPLLGITQPSANNITDQGNSKETSWVTTCICQKHQTWLYTLGILMGLAVRSTCSQNISLHPGIWQYLIYHKFGSLFDIYGYATEAGDLVTPANTYCKDQEIIRQLNTSAVQTRQAMTNLEAIDTGLGNAVKYFVNSIPLTVQGNRSEEYTCEYVITQKQALAPGIMQDTKKQELPLHVSTALQTVPLDLKLRKLSLHLTIQHKDVDLHPTYHPLAQYTQLSEQRALQHYTASLKSIRAGITAILPEEIFQGMNEATLMGLVCGDQNIEITELQSNTIYKPEICSHAKCQSVVAPHINEKYATRSKCIHAHWFWNIMGRFTPVQRRQWIQFAWARTSLPRGDVNYRMQVAFNHSKALPSSETCFFNVTLGLYESEEEMESKMITAMFNCMQLNS